MGRLLSLSAWLGESAPSHNAPGKGNGPEPLAHEPPALCRSGEANPPNPLALGRRERSLAPGKGELPRWGKIETPTCPLPPGKGAANLPLGAWEEGAPSGAWGRGGRPRWGKIEGPTCPLAPGKGGATLPATLQNLKGCMFFSFKKI